jgi:hypothetical protein
MEKMKQIIVERKNPVNKFSKNILKSVVGNEKA